MMKQQKFMQLFLVLKDTLKLNRNQAKRTYIRYFLKVLKQGSLGFEVDEESTRFLHWLAGFFQKIKLIFSILFFRLLATMQHATCASKLLF